MKHVLLIEDNPGDARLIREMLSEISGFALIHADRLSIGLAMLAEQPIDVILLDLNLPDSDGMETLTRTQQVDPDTPIVILTGLGDPNIALEYLKHGVQDYLVKGQFETVSLDRAMRYAVERADIERKLRQNEELYRLTLNSISDAVFMTREDGTFTFVCDNFGLSFGWTADEAMETGSLHALLGNQADNCPVPEPDKPVSNHSWTIQDKYGNEKALLINAQCVDIQGASYLYACRDITEKRHSQEALEKSEAKFRTMIDNLNVGVVLMDTDLAVLEANRTIHTWFPDTDFQKAPTCHQIFGLDMDEECIDCPARAAIEDGRTQETIHKLEISDGRQITCRMAVSPVRDKDDRIHQLILTLEDITERIRMEDEIRQTHKMEAVGQLAGGIAHDFNNMLTVIMGGTEFAELNYKRGEDITANLQEIRHAAKRSAELTRQLLAFGRRQHLQRREVNLNEHIEEALNMIRRTIPENVKLTHVPNSDLPTVLADPGQINQVLLNLCINARDAMPEGGEISISCNPVSLDTTLASQLEELPPGDYVLLSIRDNGCGMTTDTMEHIFEPFFTTKEPGEGTGMGLATVYGIVRQHRGTVTVKSELNQGTIFRIYLPVSEKRPEKAMVAPRNGTSYGKAGSEHILLVEDDPAVQEIAASILQRAGYAVHTASDGTEALSVLDRESHRISLCVLDVIMPHMGGQELYTKIHDHWPQIRVLFTSGYTGDSAHTGFLREKNLLLLPKPFEPDQLLSMVREVLDQPGDGSRSH